MGFESFWSGVGGFVGIFLGFSLMQIPDLVSVKGINGYLNKKLMCSNNSVYEFKKTFD